MNRTTNRNAWLCAMLVTGAVLLQNPGTAFAAEEPEEFALDQIVVTANRVPTKVAESAANVSVITRSQIEKGNYQSLGQLLRQTNGVEVASYGYSGAQNFVRLNGDDRVVIMIDGRRMNIEKGAGSGRAGYDLNNFPTLSNIERIEIVKGAASALYGSDAVGGVINIITRAGGEDLTTLDFSAGSWGARNYELTQQGKEKDWRWFLSAGRQKQDHFSYQEFQNGYTKDMPNSNYQKDNFTFRLDKEIDADRSLTLNVEHSTDNSGQPGMPPGFQSSYGNPQHFPTDRKTNLTNNWAMTYNFNTQLENSGYLRIYENYYTSTFHSLSSGGSYSNKTQGIDWQNAWRLDENNLLVAGVEWRDATVDNPGTYVNRSVNNKALYLEDRMVLSEKWTFTPGIRYDRHNMFGNKTTPRASVNYKIDNTTNTYVSWGKVFNAPNADDLFTPASSWGGISFGGNPNLKPETGDTITIGINKKVDEKTQLTVSYFQSQLKDAIRWDDGANNYVASNIDKQRKEGGEIELRTVLSSRWSVSGAYSYLKVENKLGVNSTYILDPYSKPNGYRIAADYSDGKLDFNLTGRGASGRSLTAYTSSGYWVWDTAINYKLDKNTRAYFNVNNITNEDYEINGSLASSGGPGGFPMPSRNYRVGVKYSF